jgi:hypothetical protein
VIPERLTPARSAAILLAGVTALGALTLPRQLGLLGAALRHGPHPPAFAAGLERLILFDRLVPPPTVVIAGLLLAWTADPLLGLARDMRPRVWAVVVLGLAPLLAQRAGELGLTYLASVPAPVTPGSALGLPQEFVTGPAIFSRHDAPRWLQSLSARVNLVTASSVVIWATGLRKLDGGSWRAWHMFLPAACLAGAGIATWWFEGVAVALILGRP